MLRKFVTVPEKQSPDDIWDELIKRIAKSCSCKITGALMDKPYITNEGYTVETNMQTSIQPLLQDPGATSLIDGSVLSKKRESGLQRTFKMHMNIVILNITNIIKNKKLNNEVKATQILELITNPATGCLYDITSCVTPTGKTEESHKSGSSFCNRALHDVIKDYIQTKAGQQLLFETFHKIEDSKKSNEYREQFKFIDLPHNLSDSDAVEDKLKLFSQLSVAFTSPSQHQHQVYSYILNKFFKTHRNLDLLKSILETLKSQVDLETFTNVIKDIFDVIVENCTAYIEQKSLSRFRELRSEFRGLLPEYSSSSSAFTETANNALRRFAGLLSIKKEIEQRLPEIGGKIDELRKFEEYYTLNSINAVISAYAEQHDIAAIDLNAPIPEELAKQLKTVLAERWERIRHIDLRYTRHPEWPINQICLDLATTLSENQSDGEEAESVDRNKNRFCILMPTLTQLEGPVGELIDEDLQLSEFVLDNDQTGFIEVFPIFEDWQLEGRKEFRDLRHRTPTPLHKEDRQRVINSSPAAKELYDIGMQVTKVQERSKDISLKDKLVALRDKLRESSIDGPAGTDADFRAYEGGGLIEILAEFRVYLDQMPGDRKQKLMASKTSRNGKNFTFIWEKHLAKGQCTQQAHSYISNLVNNTSNAWFGTTSEERAREIDRLAKKLLTKQKKLLQQIKSGKLQNKDPFALETPAYSLEETLKLSEETVKLMGSFWKELGGLLKNNYDRFREIWKEYSDLWQRLIKARISAALSLSDSISRDSWQEAQVIWILFDNFSKDDLNATVELFEQIYTQHGRKTFVRALDPFKTILVTVNNRYRELLPSLVVIAARKGYFNTIRYFLIEQEVNRKVIIPGSKTSLINILFADKAKRIAFLNDDQNVALLGYLLTDRLAEHEAGAYTVPGGAKVKILLSKLMWQAIANGKNEFIKTILECCPQRILDSSFINTTKEADSNETFLFKALENNLSNEIIELLCKKGANLNQITTDNRSALYQALLCYSSSNNEASDTTAIANIYTLLMHAKDDRNPLAINSKIIAKAGKSVLHEVIKTLVWYPCSESAQGHKFGNFIRPLLALQGVDLNLVDKDDETILDIVCSKGNDNWTFNHQLVKDILNSYRNRIAAGDTTPDHDRIGKTTLESYVKKIAAENSTAANDWILKELAELYQKERAAGDTTSVDANDKATDARKALLDDIYFVGRGYERATKAHGRRISPFYSFDRKKKNILKVKNSFTEGYTNIYRLCRTKLKQLMSTEAGREALIRHEHSIKLIETLLDENEITTEKDTKNNFWILLNAAVCQKKYDVVEKILAKLDLGRCPELVDDNSLLLLAAEHWDDNNEDAQRVFNALLSAGEVAIRDSDNNKKVLNKVTKGNKTNFADLLLAASKRKGVSKLNEHKEKPTFFGTSATAQEKGKIDGMVGNAQKRYTF